MRHWTIILLGALVLGACAAGAAAPPVTPEAEDPFVLKIDAGRMVVFTDKIETALDIDREEGDPTGAPTPRDEIQEAADSVRKAALAYLSLKARSCIEGKFTEISCTPSTPPAWLSEPANTQVSAAEVRRRSDALYAEIGPLLNAACALGREKLDDEMFCSVE